MSPEILFDRYRAPLAWGLLMLLLVVFVLAGVLPLVQAYVARGERLDQGYERLAKLEAIASQNPDDFRQQEAELDRVLERFAFPADSGADSLVLDLRKRMDSLAEEYGVELQSVEGSRPKREDEIASVGLSVTAVAGLEAAIGMLQALPEQSPVMLVDDLSVQSAATRRSRRSAKEAAAPPEQRVSLKFRVEAFLAPGAG